jgi:hypothetical protein
MLSPLNPKAYMIEGVWPTVRDDDWCGEWRSSVRREPRLADAAAASLSAAHPPTRVSPLTSLPAGALSAAVRGSD